MRIYTWSKRFLAVPSCRGGVEFCKKFYKMC